MCCCITIKFVTINIWAHQRQQELQIGIGYYKLDSLGYKGLRFRIYYL